VVAEALVSTRALALLGLIAAALLAYVLVFERDSVTSKELSERSGRVLPSFVRDKVERITVQRKGIEVVLARKQEKEGLGDLALVSPIAAAADSDASDRLLGELEWLSARRSVDASAADLARFGLDKPRFRVSYAVGGATHLLAVGKDDVHGEGLYVSVDGASKAYVVPKTLLDVIDHEPGYFRDKSLFPALTVAWVRKLVMQPRVHTYTKESGHWWLGEPSAKQYADDKKLGELLHALAGLRASREVEPSAREEAERALSAPMLSLSATVVPDETREDKKASEQSLQVGGPCGKFADERYARVQTRLVCVRAGDLAQFEHGELALAEPRLFRAPANEIERFVIARGKQRLAWKREGSKWKSDIDAPADADAIDAWLADLAAARVQRAAPLTALSQDGLLRLELVDGQHEEVALGALTDGALPVHRGDESLIVTFPGRVYDLLTPVRTRFAPLALWPGHQLAGASEGALRPSEVVRFEARVRGKQRSGTLSDGAWSVDNERVRFLVRALVAAKPLAYLSDHARPEHGFGADGVSLGLKDKTLSLSLGAATDRGVYARIGDDVLELSSLTLAQLEELAGGARAPDPPAEDDDEHDGDEPHSHLEEH
jgi:Domain of unknown function (DUF4340)